MLVICEECGKKYKIDPAKIKGDKAIFKCKNCACLITVRKPQETPLYSASKSEFSQTAAKPDPQTAAGDTGIRYSKKMHRFGLKGKMITLFLVLPILIIAASGVLYLMQFRSLSNLHTKEGAKVISQMAKYMIIEKSRAVSGQCRVYLDGHPSLTKEFFVSDVDLKKLAVNKIGQTGETFLYSISEFGKPAKIWLHSNEKLHGMAVKEAMEKLLGSEYKKYMKIWKYPEEAKNLESAGLYLLKDDKGQLREQYIFLSPIGETKFGIAGATYLDEFTRPIRVMEARTAMSSVRVRNTIIGIVAGTLLLFAVIVSFYGYHLTERIKSLTELANRISIGELDTKIDMKTGDEIEDLANAVTRMQASIKLAIGRFRRNQ